MNALMVAGMVAASEVNSLNDLDGVFEVGIET